MARKNNEDVKIVKKHKEEKAKDVTTEHTPQGKLIVDLPNKNV